MGKKIRLGLLLESDENWIGGRYYILNLISALNTLPEQDRPKIVLLSRNENDLIDARKTGYSDISFSNPFNYKRNFWEAVLNKAVKLIFKKAIFDKRITHKQIDVLFPAKDYECFNLIQNKIYWFPDFQHIHFPDLFSSDELKRRVVMLKEIAESNKDLILSSNSSKEDWESLKLLTNGKVYTIPFAVSHPLFDDLNIDHLYKEFNIDREYFLISNQFWKHKNHLLVLKAAAILQIQNPDYQFVFTGKEGDYHTDGYFKTLIDFIDQNGLKDRIKFLGLIDRRKQLKLMKHAKAVIQPSLFEGWSTVIEDAKAIGKIIIVSDIPVHREQISLGCYFFDPYKETDLANKILSFLTDTVDIPAINYHENVLKFGKQFQKIIQSSIDRTNEIRTN